MARIGGNTEAVLQVKAGSSVNAIGERVHEWADAGTLCGWLDMQSGDARYTYNAKLQEMSHIFLCDYTPIDLSPENKRLVVDGVEYDVLSIDDPMGLHQQLEISLRRVG